MNIELWWQGKTRDKYLQPGIDDYSKRINFFNRFDIREFNVSKAKRPEDQVAKDDQGYLKHLDTKSLVVMLDEKGAACRQENFLFFVRKS